MSTPPHIAIVIPVRNGGAAFGECLARLAGISPPPGDVVVVDDGSEDGSGERARAAGVRVVRLEPGRGPGAARNAGVRHARGAVVWFLDADVLAPPTGMRQLEEAFADPEIAAVIGSYDRHPRAGNFLSQLKNLSHRHVHQSAREEAFTFWGACGAVRREAFDAVGGFDERYRAPSIEDIELGYRLRRAGYRIRLLKTLEVTHLKRWTIRGLLRTDIVGRAWPWSKLLLREGRIENDLNVAWRGRAAVAAAGCLVLALALAPWVAAARAAALLAIATLLVLDAPLLQYLAAERGWTFAVRAIPWRWLAHACSGATFGLAAVHWWVRDRRLG